MTNAQSANILEQGATTRPATGRPVIYATQGIISSGHYLTSMAGMRMLVAGGNAFDAIVAAGFAAAVVEPIASYSLARRGGLHAVPRQQWGAAVTERPGGGARQGHCGLLQVPGGWMSFPPAQGHRPICLSPCPV